MAVPGRRYTEFVDVLAEVQPLCVGAAAELIGEVPWTPAKAKDSPKKRKRSANPTLAPVMTAC